MKRIIVLLLLLVSAITTVHAFQIQQYNYNFDGFFIEIYSLNYLPTIYTDKKDGYIDIKVYSLDQEDLTGALTIADVRVSGDPLYAIRQTVKENQRLTLPVDSMKGLRLLVVTSESKTAKVITSYRTVGAQLLKHERGAMLRLWTREDSIFVKDFSLYRLRDGSL
ncbi:MAG TPA: alpha-2-macroglobulin domain protein, partial [Mesotoga sp.]|nr:alpha-2-macroglobulin domain protein [Mesotoga sp.]